MKQQLAQPKRAALPDPAEGRPVTPAGSEAIVHMLEAVCKRLDRIVALEARLDALEQQASGGRER
jgi:hypothetical protein